MNDSWMRIKSVKLILLVISIIPITIISCIYIGYGEIMESNIEGGTAFIRIHQLKMHYDFFKDLIILPAVVKNLGYYSIVSLYSLYFIWFILSFTLAYKELSNHTGSTVIILFELITLATLFIYSINPGLNRWLSVLIFFLLIIYLIMTLLYWYYRRFNKP